MRLLFRHKHLYVTVITSYSIHYTKLYEQLEILNDQFEFYSKLPIKQKQYFEHRVAKFIKQYPFYGKDGLEITDEIQVLIAATAIMLTFGMRNNFV